MKSNTIDYLRGWGIAILRVGTGTIFLVRGLEKLLVKDLSSLVTTSSGAVELLCGAALVLGLFTRWVSIPLAMGMLVNVLVIHFPNGFFVWNDGYEYPLLRLTACLALMLVGPGKVALGNTIGLQKMPAVSRLQW
jgi:putative oxidoreductase